MLGPAGPRLGQVLAACLCVAFALAGCAKPSDSKKPDLKLADGSGVDLDEAAAAAQGSNKELGVVSGVVVDAVIRPIAHANITVVSANRTVQSDKAGIFVVPDLEAGTYFLRVAADGYTSTQTSVEVQSGQTSKVRVVLETSNVVKPYHGQTMDFRGFYQASTGFADEVLDLAVWNHTYGPVTIPSGCTCHFDFASEANVTTLVMELVWDEPIEHADDHPFGGGWTMDVVDQDGKGPLMFCQTAADDPPAYDPPCVIHEDSTGNFTHTFGNFSIGVWSDASWAYVNEKFELYVTPFYGAPAPDGWSFIKGDP